MRRSGQGTKFRQTHCRCSDPVHSQVRGGCVCLACWRPCCGFRWRCTTWPRKKSSVRVRGVCSARWNCKRRTTVRVRTFGRSTVERKARSSRGNEALTSWAHFRIAAEYLSLVTSAATRLEGVEQPRNKATKVWLSLFLRCFVVYPASSGMNSALRAGISSKADANFPRRSWKS